MAELETQVREAADTEDRRGFEVQLGDFSGPLDLLCHLVDIREMDPVKLNLTELISQYVRFLMESKRTTLNEMAEFFSFASRLLLRKVHSLFPSQQADVEDVLPEEDDGYTEEELLRMLENFRPYRAAAAYLAERQRVRERCFSRALDEDAAPFYDLGDLYSLASRWYELLDDYSRRASVSDWDDGTIWDEIPDAVPEERQVEERMDELLGIVRKGKRLGLRELLSERGRKALIVTLLAMLEMSRLGMVRIEQGDTLGDVFVVSV